MGVHVVDLRGQGGSRPGGSVLADPSGRRRRHLARMARGVACLLGVWICGLGLAGIGLLPGRLEPWAWLVGSPSSPPRQRLEHPWRSKAVTQPSPLAPSLRSATSSARSRDRQRGAPAAGPRRGDGQPSHAHGQRNLERVERARIAPRRHRSLHARVTAPARLEAGGQSSSSTQNGAARQSSAMGPPHVPAQPTSKRAEAPGRGELAPGWGVAMSTTQTSTTRSGPMAGHASAPERPEARGHEKTTLTPP